MQAHRRARRPFASPWPSLSLAGVVAVVALHVAALDAQPPSSRARVVIVDGHEAVAGEVLVRFANLPSEAGIRLLMEHVDADVSVPLGRSGLHRVRSRVFDLDTLLAFLRAQPNVAFAEPNYILRIADIPDDPDFGKLWGLLNIGQTVSGRVGLPGADIRAAAAWGVSTGSKANVVAVIDTGVDYTHPDLAANMWSAPAPFTVTIGGLAITCPAGSHGFNAIARTCDPMDDNNHGTHVAGTIGAAGNNARGVAGVNWTASLIAGKFLGASGSGTTANAIDTLEFMRQVRAAFPGTAAGNITVLNNSWGGGGFSMALHEAIQAARAEGMLFVAAAGNNGSNTDSAPFYPASYDLANIVSVAATDNTDVLASFSNFGASSVDLAAPGVSILSTTVGNTYQSFNGTSMAAPHVSGAAALVLSACNLDTAGLKDLLLANVDVPGPLTGLVNTDGRLNVDRAIRACATGIPSAPSGLAATAGDRQVALAWGAAGGAVSYRLKRAETSGGPYAEVAAGVSSTSHTDTGLTNGVRYYYVVSAENASGEGPDSQEASAVPLLEVPSRPTKLKAAPGDGRVSLAWQAAESAEGYHVKRSLAKAGPYALLAPSAGTAFVDTAVNNGTTYYYVVSAMNAAGESRQSNKASAYPAPVPAPPHGVTAEPGDGAGEIRLSWSPADWATGYKVKRSRVDGGPYSSGRKTSHPMFTDTGLKSGVRYFYVVTALNASGESVYSVQVTAVAP